MSVDELAHHARRVRDLVANVFEIARSAQMPPDNARLQELVAYQLFGVAAHHSVAIVTLILENGPDMAASAFALHRPLFEVLQRAWWFATCATDEQTERFTKNDEFPLRNIADVGIALDRKPPFVGQPFFTVYGSADWKIQNSFTHGGMYALGAYSNRMDPPEEFDSEPLTTLLSNTARLACLAAMGVCWTIARTSPDVAGPLYNAVLVAGKGYAPLSTPASARAPAP